MSCFKGIVHALACSASYADGIRRTLVAGGENVGRASLVGPVAWLCMSLTACLSDAMTWLAAVRGCLLLPCVKRRHCQGQGITASSSSAAWLRHPYEMASLAMCTA